MEAIKITLELLSRGVTPAQILALAARIEADLIAGKGWQSIVNDVIATLKIDPSVGV